MEICSTPLCNNYKIGDSYHCLTCVDIHKPAYLAYKDIHCKVDIMLNSGIENLSVYSLLKLSSRLEKVYNLRSEYRKLAFRKDLWDEGHDIALKMVLSNLSSVRLELEKRFNFVKNEEEEKEEYEEVTDAYIHIESVYKHVIQTESSEEWLKSPDVIANIEANKLIEKQLIWLKDKLKSYCNEDTLTIFSLLEIAKDYVIRENTSYSFPVKKLMKLLHLKQVDIYKRILKYYLTSNPVCEQISNVKFFSLVSIDMMSKYEGIMIMFCYPNDKDKIFPSFINFKSKEYDTLKPNDVDLLNNLQSLVPSNDSKVRVRKLARRVLKHDNPIHTENLSDIVSENDINSLRSLYGRNIPSKIISELRKSNLSNAERIIEKVFKSKK